MWREEGSPIAKTHSILQVHIIMTKGAAMATVTHKLCSMGLDMGLIAMGLGRHENGYV
jgi:hypothetical protein